MDINKRIKILRNKKNLSQRDFAAKIGYTNGTIAQIELGRSKVERRLIVALSYVFGVREEWLLTGDEPMFQDSSDPIDLLIKKYKLTSIAENILRGYLSLDEEKRNALSSLIAEMSSKVLKQSSL